MTLTWVEYEAGLFDIPYGVGAPPQSTSYTYGVEVPFASRVVRVVCDAAIVARGFSQAEELANLGTVMTWSHDITRIEPASGAHPSGLVRMVNRQRGAMVQSSTTGLVMSGAVILGSAYLFNWAGDIDLVNEQRSEGTIGIGEGTVDYQAVLFLSAHPYLPSAPTTPWIEWSFEAIIRVLYET